jgi:hypothetical protein
MLRMSSEPIRRRRSSPVVLLEPIDTADERRLARPRGPDHHHYFLFSDLHVDVLQGLEVPKELVDIDQLDERLALGLRGVG